MPASFTISLRPADVAKRLARKRDRVSAVIRVLLSAGVARVAERARDRAVDHTPLGEGEARAGWVVEVRGDRHRVYNRLTRTRRGLAKMLAIEFGSAPHPIAARRARVLRFRAEDGRTLFRRRVMHPGTRAYAPTRIAAGIAAVEVEDLRRLISREVSAAWGG